MKNDSTNQYKGKNQPLEDQMKESWNRTQSLIMNMQVIFFFIAICYTAIGIAIMCISFLVFHYSLDIIWKEITYYVIAMFSTFGIGVLIGYIYHRNMMKEYD